jgi:NAD(P)-dependent dehydrogenase (short-subunit alcohol dehydrogenase family)
MNAIITGASRGIGKAIARIYAQHGYDLLLTSQNEYRLLETIEELQKDFPQINIQGQAFDLGTREGTRLLGEWILGQADTIDILVNNAGTFVPGNVSDEPEGSFGKNPAGQSFFSLSPHPSPPAPHEATAKRTYIFHLLRGQHQSLS